MSTDIATTDVTPPEFIKRGWAMAPGSAAAGRAALLAAVTLASSACANQPLNGGTPQFASPMRLLNTDAAAADAPQPVKPLGATEPDVAHKSLAAKVLASRALETVTGLKTDPARLSEHD